MKEFKFLLITMLCLVITLGCLKEETNNTTKTIKIEKQASEDSWDYFHDSLLDVTSRNGNVPDQMMYLNSLSMNNIWLSQNLKETPIKHTLYNKSKIRSIMFTPGVNPNINYNNRTWKHYNARVNFNDGDVESFTTYLIDTLFEFVYIPNGYNYLPDNHIGNYVLWEQNLSIPYELKMNGWRMTTSRGYTWEVYVKHSGNLNHIATQTLWAYGRNTNGFTIPYIN